MFSSYLKTALRSLMRDKAYSLINVAGLSIGIACCLILGLNLISELSYDRHHVNGDRVYRLVNEFSINGGSDYAAITSTQVGRMMFEQFDEIVAYARFSPTPNPRWLMRSEGEDYYWENVYSANNGAFQLFSHDVIYGDPESVLKEPGSMAVSETFARQYFGAANPIGERIQTESNDYRIDLVFRDLPANSHLKYDALLSYENIGDPDPQQALQQLWNIGLYTYLMFDEDYDTENFSRLSEQFFEESMVPFARAIGIDASVRFTLEPLTDIHLRSTTSYDLPRGDIFYVYAFSAIALFVLLVASINYMNLATARATRRAKEVGMRKVIGASRGQLVGQFIGESLFYALLSLLLALVLCYLLINLTGLQQLFDTELDFMLLLSPGGFAILLAGAVLIGLISGSYPAFYLSSIQPQSAFKGGDRAGRSGSRMREGLVLVQFIISVAVIASTLLMLAQMNFVQSRELGFDERNKIVVTVQGSEQIERIPSLRNDLLQLNGVRAVANSFHLPGTPVSINALRVDDNNGTYTDQTINRMDIGFGIVDALDLTIVEGRDLDETRETDTDRAALVNEAMVRFMGWDEPLGKRIRQFGDNAEDQLVVGVLQDFHYAGLQEEVSPIILRVFEPDFSQATPQQRLNISTQLVISVEEGAIGPVTEYLQGRWPDFDEAHPLEYRLLQDTMDELYGSEQRQMQLIGLFATICIFISCLGLYGLSAFNTAQRTKEIGIRKVLGASSPNIILLLFRRVMALLLLASVIASLFSYWAIGEWLQNFYYRIDLVAAALLNFTLATLLALVVAFATMALQSFRTAQANPVKSLRYE